MTKSKRMKILVYRFLAIVVLAVSLIVLPAGTSSSQTDCCGKCLERFFQCDANSIVCCQIYTSCVQHCQGGCPSCPDD
jgi:hypothetical protein